MPTPSDIAVAPSRFGRRNKFSMHAVAASRSAVRSTRPIDWLFAATTCSLFLGDIIGILPSALFLLCTAALAINYLNIKFDFRAFFSVLTLPLMAFTLMHLMSSLTYGVDSAITRLLQLVPSYLFSFLLLYEYSRRSMKGFLTASAVLGGALLLFVIVWHISQGIFMPLKYFYETKTIFSLIPIGLFFAVRINDVVWRYALVFALFLVLAMSGERKAYIAFAVSAVFIFDPRKPVNILLAVCLVVGIMVLIQTDETGYLAQQFGSLLALGEGKVENTVSNLTRDWQLKYALSAWNTSPIFGIGTNGYLPLVQSEYRSTDASELVILNNVGIHGEPLRVLVENGVVGIIAWITLIITSIYPILRRFFSGQDRDDAILALLIFVSAMCYLSFEAFDTNAVVYYGLLPSLWRLKLRPTSDGDFGTTRTSAASRWGGPTGASARASAKRMRS